MGWLIVALGAGIGLGVVMPRLVARPDPGAAVHIGREDTHGSQVRT